MFALFYVLFKQRRNNLSVVHTHSDRKLTAEQYIQQRTKYLEIERRFRKTIEVIVKKPQNYQQDEYEEIWDEEEEYKWDGERELNGDEVPFIIDMTSKQIISEGERAGVLKKGLHKSSKYRQGTLWIISNCFGILMVVVIFPNGGKVVAAKLIKQMLGNLETKVYWVCSKSGSMTTRIWLEVMIMLQNRTKSMRGCQQLSGRDWKKAIVLNLDNYAVHLNVDIAARFAAEYGIFIRCLLKNASHLQQPVDQHIGLLLKRRIKSNIHLWLIRSNRFVAHTKVVKVDAQKWREMVCRFVVDAVAELDHPKYLNIFVLSWVNYGLYLPLDGSADGDINTLHSEARKLNPMERTLRTQQCINTVIIRKKTNFTFQREWNTQNDVNIRYSIKKACENSNVETAQDDIDLLHLEYDLEIVNEEKLDQFIDAFEKDWTNTNNALPETHEMLCPYEVLALAAIYKVHGNFRLLKNLYINKIGISMRYHGVITHLPLPRRPQENTEILSGSMSVRFVGSNLKCIFSSKFRPFLSSKFRPFTRSKFQPFVCVAQVLRKHICFTVRWIMYIIQDLFNKY